MKKLLFSALLAGSLLLSNASANAATDEYVMCGGDQLQLTVYNHPDLSSSDNSSLNQYIVRLTLQPIREDKRVEDHQKKRLGGELRRYKDSKRRCKGEQRLGNR